MVTCITMYKINRLAKCTYTCSLRKISEDIKCVNSLLAGLHLNPFRDKGSFFNHQFCVEFIP
ncbi:hypothetical protein Mapa_005370 [Marchantia paleacea]|nr:hypothetical protein Mapa_005370 [Marchantia paleacea]